MVTLRLMDKILHRFLPAPTQVHDNNHLLRNPCAPPSPQTSMLTCGFRWRSSCARFWRDQGGLLWFRSLLFNIKHGVGIGRGWALLNTSTTRKPVQYFVHQLYQKRHCFGFPESTLPQIQQTRPTREDAAFYQEAERGQNKTGEIQECRPNCTRSTASCLTPSPISITDMIGTRCFPTTRTTEKTWMPRWLLATRAHSEPMLHDEGGNTMCTIGN